MLISLTFAWPSAKSRFFILFVILTSSSSVSSLLKSAPAQNPLFPTPFPLGI
jgi:hypothetical protein